VKVAVVGATGLIGSAICARLAGEGHHVRGLVRRRDAKHPACVEIVVMDMSEASEAEWIGALEGMDAVVNCVGALQDGAAENVSSVHVKGASALFAACVASGIRRVIHFSAIGVERAQPSEFSATKFAGDEALMASEVDWVILRPSVVLGAPVFGASALIRGLAALPWLPSMPNTAALQPVQLEDVVSTVVHFLRDESPSRVVLDLPGPEPFSMDELVAKHRAWMGWPVARRFVVPPWLASWLYRLGDLAGTLGWRPPVRSNAEKEMRRGATGDPAPWIATTGIVPTSLDAALRVRPATVQDRWFAGVYFIKPLIFSVLPFFWIMTGIISLTIGWDSGVELMVVGGAGALSGPSVIAGALADMIVGVLIAWRRIARLGLLSALALCGFYGIAGTILRPDLWAEPLGPLMKILPIVLLHLVALAILKER
jgi:uncharacterized protein YbjT (DUF2867 family)